MRYKFFIYSLLIILVGCTIATNKAEACATSKKFYVESYGAIGDGKTNDISAFHSLVKDVNANGGGVIVFPKERVFSISIVEDYNSGHKACPIDGAIGFNFEHCKKVVIDMNGSTIRLTPNHSTKYAFFLFFDCTFFSLSDGFLVGDAVGHNYMSVLYNGKEEKTSHEWGYGVYVRGSKGKIKNVGISQMTGDGVYFGSLRLKDGLYHAKLEIDGSEISYCRRNGISCASSVGFKLSNSRIHHIGDWEKSYDMPISMVGCLPKSGVDFEYEGTAGDVGNVNITKCVFEDCTKFCMIASNTSKPETSNFIVQDCAFSGSPVHIANLSSRGKKDVRDSRFFDASAFLGDAKAYRCVFEMGAVMNYVSRTSFYDCTFNGHLEELDSKHGCFMAGTNDDKTLFQRCKFKNIKGYNDLTPAFQGFSGYVHPVNIDFVSCEFDNCSFVVSQKNYDSRLSFASCTLKNGCLIHNMGVKAITFTDSELYDVSSYATQNGAFSLINCIIVQEDESVARPLLSFGTHTMNKCTVIDKVGITSSARRKYGVKEYKIEATDTDFKLENEPSVTKGLILRGGSVSGVKAGAFQGAHEKTSFK